MTVTNLLVRNRNYPGELHSIDSSNEVPDLHTTQTRISEAHFSVTTEYLNKLLPRGHQRGNWRKPRVKQVFNLINSCPTNLILLLNLNGIFEDVVCVLRRIFLTWCWVLMLGPQVKGRKHSKDKANFDWNYLVKYELCTDKQMHSITLTDTESIAL